MTEIPKDGFSGGSSSAPEARGALGGHGGRDLGMRRLLMGLMAVAVVAQGWLLFSTFLRPFQNHIQGLSSRTFLERSAHLTYGPKFAGYISFLRSQIPEDAVVLQPSFADDPLFGHQGFMQYFLFPRQVVSCPTDMAWAACLDKEGGPRTYILAVGGFPKSMPPGSSWRYVGYESDRGVFLPSPAESPASP